jgi:hypothetical protein
MALPYVLLVGLIVKYGVVLHPGAIAPGGDDEDGQRVIAGPFKDDGLLFQFRYRRPLESERKGLRTGRWLDFSQQQGRSAAGYGELGPETGLEIGNNCRHVEIATFLMLKNFTLYDCFYSNCITFLQ